MDASHTLVVTPPSIAVTGVSATWGSETVALETQGDNLRLLPSGRATDMPWFGINQVALTLSQAATVNPGDVHVTGIAVGDYGPVTVSGSGTASIVITLQQMISNPDRVTLSIGNDDVITYTRRLDVLPGDVDDNDAVNTTDGVLILRNMTPAHGYNPIYDMNGDGAVRHGPFRPRTLPHRDSAPGAGHATGRRGDGRDACGRAACPLSSTADAVKFMTTGGAASTSPKAGLDASLVDAILAANSRKACSPPRQSFLGMGKKRTHGRHSPDRTNPTVRGASAAVGGTPAASHPGIGILGPFAASTVASVVTRDENPHR